MESWKVNLISVWFGCFFTGLAISQILPFLPLYISQLGVSSHEALSMWSGLTFSITFLISAIVSPMWGSLADRKGRKLMLLRASLGMAIAILLQAFATHVWQLFLLRGIMGLTSGYIPNAMALVASQVPRERSGWALSTLSTAQISGVIGGPLMGGFVADHIGLRAVFLITAMLLVVSFLVTLFLIKEGVRPVIRKSERLSGKAVFASLPYPALVISLFFTTMVIRLCRWRDVTRRTNVIGEILQRSNYRTYFWLQPVIYVSGQRGWAVDGRDGIGDGRFPLGFYRYGGDRVDQYWATDPGVTSSA